MQTFCTISQKFFIIFILLPIIRFIDQQQKTTMFGISIFSQPEHFISLYIGLEKYPKKGLQQLKIQLGRTKNPPIAAIYTSQLLQQKFSEEYSISIIRFLSQLSDLSQGSSMSSSLYNVINESSFLTEIRHNLTHKIKISSYLIDVSRRIILKELFEKYWEFTFRKYMESYRVQISKIEQYYEKIYGQNLSSQMISKIKMNERKVTAEWLQNESNNFQFKQFFPTYYAQNLEKQTLDLIKQLPSHKKAIAISYLLGKFCFSNKDEKLCQFLVKMFKSIEPQVLNQNLIFTNLKKLSFIHYIGLSDKVLSSLPQEIKNKIDNHWKSKEEMLEKNGKKGKIFRKYTKA